MEHAAKILLLGKTKAGKSSFINYFLGKNLAKAGPGAPVTMEYFIPYEITDGRYPVNIYDTKGVEALHANFQLEQITQSVKRQNDSDDIFDWFHTIFYCVSMADPRFQPYEAEFIRKLHRELSQHIHIILTHCDTPNPDAIACMRKEIKEKLGDVTGVELFEVVSVSKKKRNGQIVEPYGKEAISERVFDLLLEDIADKLSQMYAKALTSSMTRAVDKMFTPLYILVDKTIHPGSFFEMMVDPGKFFNKMDSRIETEFSNMVKSLEAVQERTDTRFQRILKPAVQLSTSYWHTASDPDFLKKASLGFSNNFSVIETTWFEKLEDLDGHTFMKKFIPLLPKFLNLNGELDDLDGRFPEEIVKEIFKRMNEMGKLVENLMSLKKNVKTWLRENEADLRKKIPSEEKVRAEAYQRIVTYVKPPVSP